MNRHADNALLHRESTSFPIQYDYHLIRMALGLVFIWSGIVKLTDPQSFSVIIEAYGIIPEITVFPAALCIALLEALAGIGLVFDVQGSLETITILLLFFMVILGYGLWLGLDVDCGCFGPDDPEADAFHGLRLAFIRDLFMMAAIGFLFYRRLGRKIKPLPLKTIFRQ